jgi:hypothetical protein
MNEADLINKLIKIEGLFAGAATEGERDSAERAKQRILQRLKELLPEDPPIVVCHIISPDFSHNKIPCF